MWKGTDKVTRLSTINDYGEGGLKMIDLESMVKALRLAWLKRIFNANDGTWKRYLHKVEGLQKGRKCPNKSEFTGTQETRSQCKTESFTSLIKL